MTCVHTDLTGSAVSRQYQMHCYEEYSFLNNKKETIIFRWIEVYMENIMVIVAQYHSTTPVKILKVSTEVWHTSRCLVSHSQKDYTNNFCSPPPTPQCWSVPDMPFSPQLSLETQVELKPRCNQPLGICWRRRLWSHNWGLTRRVVWTGELEEAQVQVHRYSSRDIGSKHSSVTSNSSTVWWIHQQLNRTQLWLKINIRQI